MKFFVRFTKDNKHWALVDAQHLPAAVALCKTYREDCIVSRMDEATITPKAFLNFDVLSGQVDLKEAADQFVYELQYQDNAGDKREILIECAKYELEELSNKAMATTVSIGNKYVKGVLFEIEVLGTKQIVLSKKVSKKNVPICIIINKGKKKKNVTQIENNKHENAEQAIYVFTEEPTVETHTGEDTLSKDIKDYEFEPKKDFPDIGDNVSVTM